MADELLAFLFTDMVDSVRLRSSIGEERFEKIRLRQKNEVVIAVEVHAGQVIKDTGDGIVAVFHDPVKAVIASIEASQAVLDQHIAVRFGLSIGQATVIREDGRITDMHGLAVDTAARVMGVARSYQVLCSRGVYDAVWSHLRGSVSFDLIESLALKGLGGQIELYEARNANLIDQEPTKMKNGLVWPVIAAMLVVMLFEVLLFYSNASRISVLEAKSTRWAVVDDRMSTVLTRLDRIDAQFERTLRR